MIMVRNLLSVFLLSSSSSLRKSSGKEVQEEMSQDVAQIPNLFL